MRKALRPRGPAGLLEWTSRDDILAKLSRCNLLVGGLSVVAGVWLLGLYPPVDAATVEGVVVMEFATAVPLVLAVRSRRRLRDLLRRIDGATPGNVYTFARDAQEADERSWRLGQLIDQLDGSAHGEARRQSRRASDSAARTHRALLERRHHLLQMREVVEATSARTNLEQSLRTCDAQLQALIDATDDIAAAVAQLLSDASNDSVQQALAGIESASLQLTSLAAAWRELDTLDPPPATSR